MKPRTTPTDEELVDRARAGDYPAFEALVDRYGALVYSFALLSQQNPGSAEELTLSTFVTALENLAGFSCPDTFGAWVLAIAVRETRTRREGECARIRL